MVAIVKSEKQFFDNRQNITENVKRIVNASVTDNIFRYRLNTRNAEITSSAVEPTTVLVDDEGRMLAVKVRLKKQFSAEKKYRVYRLQRPIRNWN